VAQIGLLTIMIELRITAFRVPVVWSHIVVVKKRCGIQTFFSTTPYAAIPYFGTLL
jgi:hypothetical protein